MALSANAMATLANLKDFVGVSDTRMDTELERYIETASNAIREYLEFDPVETTYTDEAYNGTGFDYLRLTAKPITAVTSVKVDDTAADITDLKFDDTHIYLPGSFPSGFQNIKVSYTAGYSTLPSLFESTCLRIAALLYKERDGRIGVNSQTEEGGSRTYYEVQFTKFLEELYSYKKAVL